MLTISRHHDIACGHRVCGHESKCARIHGHGYRITFTCTGATDQLGRIIDFSVIKDKLCDWLEREWDHRTLIFKDDPILPKLNELENEFSELAGSVLPVSFNPTAENMALYLLHTVGPHQLRGTSVTLTSVKVEETRKCFALASR